MLRHFALLALVATSTFAASALGQNADRRAARGGGLPQTDDRPLDGQSRPPDDDTVGRNATGTVTGLGVSGSGATTGPDVTRAAPGPTSPGVLGPVPPGAPPDATRTAPGLPFAAERRGPLGAQGTGGSNVGGFGTCPCGPGLGAFGSGAFGGYGIGLGGAAGPVFSNAEGASGAVDEGGSTSAGAGTSARTGTSDVGTSRTEGAIETETPATGSGATAGTATGSTRGEGEGVTAGTGPGIATGQVGSASVAGGDDTGRGTIRVTPENGAPAATVALTGEVTSVFGPQLFAVASEGGALLVLLPREPTARLDPGVSVTVTGTLRPFVDADVFAANGFFDADAALVQRMRNQRVVVARSLERDGLALLARDETVDPSPIAAEGSAIAADPAAFDGRRVTLRGGVAAVANPRMFTLDDAGGRITVLHPTPLSDSPREDEVIATGVVRRFKTDEMGQLYPWFQATPEVAASLQGRPVLVAELVLQQ